MTTPALSPTLISSLSDLRTFLSSIPPSSTLYLDLEGKNLSRNGTLSVLTVLVHPALVTSLIDRQRKTLKAILEDPHTPKCLWDVHNDADALWAHYKIRLAGVTDLQLLENASHTGDKTYVRGLAICIEKDLKLNFMELHRWLKTKKDVQARMSGDIVTRRPLDTKTMQYCVNDVVYLPALHNLYTKRIDSQWLKKAMDESVRRVVEACGPAYEPRSQTKTLGPWGSGLDKHVLTMDEWLERYEDDKIEARAREMLGYDDFDDWNNGPTCSKDAAWDDTFDSCWEK